MSLIVLTTGLMRSGTSVIAQTLHQLGCPQGTEMRFPTNWDSHLEWEDTRFTDRCLQGALRQEHLGEFFKEYIQSREGDLWGVKSPFALPYVRTFKTAAQWLGHEVRTIVTERPYYETVKSLREQITDDEAFKFARTLQYKLLGHLEHVPSDLTVSIKDSWLDPQGVRDKLERMVIVSE
jgi:hypothetical protein